MNVQELTERLTQVLSAEGGENLPIHRDYEDTAFSLREKNFVILGLHGIKITDEGEQQRYIATYSLAFYADPASSGAKLLNLAHGFFHPRLFSSELNVERLQATAIAYNAKLDRLEYSFALDIGCTLKGDVLSPIKSDRVSAVSFPLSEKLLLKAESFSLARGRALSEIPTICTGAFLGDGGNKGAILELKGILYDEKGAALLGGAAIRAVEGLLEKAIAAAFLGINLPPLRLKSYSISGSGKLPVCELTLVSVSAAEVIGGA